jgi:hypothetical protein
MVTISQTTTLTDSRAAHLHREPDIGLGQRQVGAASRSGAVRDGSYSFPWKSSLPAPG